MFDEQVDSNNSNHERVLCWAVSPPFLLEKQPRLEELIKYGGVDPNILISSRQVSPIVLAAEFRNVDAVSFLLKQPATQNIGQALLAAIEGFCGAFSRPQVAKGFTLLSMLASDQRCDQYRCFEDVSRIFGGGQTALHKLCWHSVARGECGAAIAKILVEERRFDVNATDDNGCTPLRCLQSWGGDGTPLESFLISRGASLDGKPEVHSFLRNGCR